MSCITVRLDRVQILSRASDGESPPRLDGCKVVRDILVRSQTTVKTYARCREYESTVNGMKIFWQYHPLQGWLMPWKISIMPDDETGLSFNQLGSVLLHCSNYRFLTIEVAIDFDLSMGIDKKFVRQHGVFGKSHRSA